MSIPLANVDRFSKGKGNEGTGKRGQRMEEEGVGNRYIGKKA